MRSADGQYAVRDGQYAVRDGQYAVRDGQYSGRMANITSEMANIPFEKLELFRQDAKNSVRENSGVHVRVPPPPTLSTPRELPLPKI